MGDLLRMYSRARRLATRNTLALDITFSFSYPLREFLVNTAQVLDRICTSEVLDAVCYSTKLETDTFAKASASVALPDFRDNQNRICLCATHPTHPNEVCSLRPLNCQPAELGGCYHSIAIRYVVDDRIEVFCNELDMYSLVPQDFPILASQLIAFEVLVITVVVLLVLRSQYMFPSFRPSPEIGCPAGVTEFGATGAGHVVASICFLYHDLAGWALYDRSLLSIVHDLHFHRVQCRSRHVLLARFICVPWSTTGSAGVCSAAEACPL